jgi:hypothetical protein
MGKLLALCLVLFAGCAQMKTTVVETEPAQAGKPARTTRLEVAFSGTSGGARSLLDAETRRVQTLQSGDVAKAAIAKGMPATLGQDAARSDVQGGYTYGYGAYGMYGAGSYGGSSAVMYTEAASLGHVPGYLPRLGEAPVYVQSQSHVVQTAGGLTACPSGRAPATDAEVTACTAQNLKEVRKKVYGR